MKSIISASRRTDLPRYYLDDVIDEFEQGYVDLINPFNQQPYRVDLDREHVGCIVWWSKDYREFLERRDYFKRFNQFFQFTVNGYRDKNTRQLLEPGVTSSLDDRLDQMQQLAMIFSPGKITWRFDPIVHWTEGDGDDAMNYNNLGDFVTISNLVGKIGVKRCAISFVQIYGKVATRVKRAKGRFGGKVVFHDLDDEMKRHKARELAIINKKINGITTYSCANSDIIDNKWVFPSHCIDGDLLGRLFGEKFSASKDAGQRDECGCTRSIDIGGYDQACLAGCIYCYANPKVM